MESVEEEKEEEEWPLFGRASPVPIGWTRSRVKTAWWTVHFTSFHQPVGVLSTATNWSSARWGSKNARRRKRRSGRFEAGQQESSCSCHQADLYSAQVITTLTTREHQLSLDGWDLERGLLGHAQPPLALPGPYV